MKEATVILHGWSDCSESFVQMKQFLIDHEIGDVSTILYADYQSREDSLTFDDVVEGLYEQFIRCGFIDFSGNPLCNLNVIVHSTGGLVIRHWITRFYYEKKRIDQCPVKRLIMLAPANFGSPLAHRGKSFLGSLVVGRWKVGDFLEVGRQLLDGLELGSAYQWELAHRDLIIDQPFYNAKQIQTTILVGIEDYMGVKSWVNKPGTDGTVVIAGTSLDTAKLVLDFSETNYQTYQSEPHRWVSSSPPEDFAFGILEHYDHGSIISAIRPGELSEVGQILLEALYTQDAADFGTLQNKLEMITAQTYAATKKPRFQQFILHTVDDHGAPIRDFTVEFFIYKSNKKETDRIITGAKATTSETSFSEQIQAIFSAEAHPYTNDPSYRRFLVNVQAVDTLLAKAVKALKSDVVLSLKIHIPSVDKGILYRTEDLQNIILLDTGNPGNNLLQFFYDNTTTLVELRVNRFNSYVKVGIHPIKE